jgi:hypothetical protein
MNEPKPPVAFVSYSHDTPTHKKWVGDLASKLMANGVSVILDQWDLVLGDDVPKFMEKGVSEADCVLMICTESYVRKADDGKGGAGYEAMIVTGELVKNLGSSKFVPVIRQENGSEAVPKSVSTRLFVNLSEDKNFDEGFQDLLHKIHKVPKTQKPALGTNPFLSKENTVVLQDATLSAFATVEPMPVVAAELYKKASRAAQANDLLGWRGVLKEARKASWEDLAKWRTQYEKKPPEKANESPDRCHTGFAAVSPLFAVALAGVESSHEKFKNQVALVDDLLNPPDWRDDGHFLARNFTDTLVFIYQALHGAISMETGQVALAAELARSAFHKRFERKKIVLMEEHAWVGWPGSISENCTDAWDFLCALPDKNHWLLEIFGTKQEYLASLSSYYAMLNILELTTLASSGKSQLLDNRNLRLDVPLCGFVVSRDVAARAYRMLVHDKAELKKLWTDYNVSTESLKILWPKWIGHCSAWLFNVYQRRGLDPSLYHGDLFQERGIADGLPGVVAVVG